MCVCMCVIYNTTVQNIATAVSVIRSDSIPVCHREETVTPVHQRGPLSRGKIHDSSCWSRPALFPELLYIDTLQGAEFLQTHPHTHAQYFLSGLLFLPDSDAFQTSCKFSAMSLCWLLFVQELLFHVEVRVISLQKSNLFKLTLELLF